MSFQSFGMRAAAWVLTGASSLALTVAGCASPVPVTSRPLTIDDVAPLPTPEMEASPEPIHVMTRRTGTTETVSLIAFSDEEIWQGLRTPIRADGTTAGRTHTLFIASYSFPNLARVRGAQWIAFVDGTQVAEPLVVAGPMKDDNACREGRCTPSEVFLAQIPDELLRLGRDSIVVAVRPKDLLEPETTILLRRPLMKRFLATLDSITAARTKKQRG